MCKLLTALYVLCGPHSEHYLLCQGQGNDRNLALISTEESHRICMRARIEEVSNNIWGSYGLCEHNRRNSVGIIQTHTYSLSVLAPYARRTGVSQL